MTKTISTKSAQKTSSITMLETTPEAMPESNQKKNRRRQFLSFLGLGSIGLGGLSISGADLSIKSAHAHHTDTHFDEISKHKLVYQLNKADHAYIESILFSCGEMLRKYGDDIELVVTTFGQGLHLLAKYPKRPISEIHKQRVQSLSEYGVQFQACGNTMKTLHWTEKDIVKYATIVPIGIDGIMQLQEQGFSYISL
jgi:intracellular sulfur oxidation DsrE/DsrF family protein